MYSFTNILRRTFSNIVIVNGKRTPVGSFMGQLSSIPAPTLGAIAIKAALNASGVKKNEVDEVFMGNVICAGVGQAPARQASIQADLPTSVICTTINKVCASGMKAVQLGMHSILAGTSNVVVAGGMENMSLAPHFIYMRKGLGFGDGKLTDGILSDGLRDAGSQMLMGACVDKTHKTYKITRQEQDNWSIRSYERAIDATKKGILKNEIVPVSAEVKKGVRATVDKDEECFKFMKDKIPTLKPAFTKDGTVTAANASKNCDGGAAMVLMSEELAKKKNLRPVARIVGFADAAIAPVDFCFAPSFAIKKLLAQTKMTLKDIDFFEINEAFAGTALTNMKLLGIPAEKVNVNGSAVALGHPLGMSGARVVLALINVLQHHKARFGLSAICNGGGGASSILLERLI